jgi:hypothetical protein
VKLNISYNIPPDRRYESKEEGAKLHRARIQIGLSYQEAAELYRILPMDIIALEEGRAFCDWRWAHTILTERYGAETRAERPSAKAREFRKKEEW